jgi:hypothetical protein
VSIARAGANKAAGFVAVASDRDENTDVAAIAATPATTNAV